MPRVTQRYLQLGCQISELGYLPDQTPNNRNRTLHALFFCIILCSDGKGQALVNGKPAKNKSRPPFLTIHTPGTVLHTLQPSLHDEIYFCYSGEHAENMMKMDFQNGHFEMTPEIREIISQLRHNLCLPDSPGKADRIDLLALQLLVAIRESQEMSSEKYREDGTRFPELVNYLAMHYLENPSLSFLLHKFGFSRRTFFRLWKKKYTCTYSEYLNDLKLKHGENLLVTTDLSVDEITQQCAFASATYFIRRFKKYYGMTPVAYKKMCRAEKYLP